MALLLVASLYMFVRVRDKEAMQETVSQSPTTSVRVLLADTTMPTPNSLKSALADLWDLTAQITVTTTGTTTMYSIPFAEAHILLTIKPEPLPSEEFQGISPLATLWDEAASDLQRHKAYIGIDVYSDQLSAALRHLLCSHITAAVALRTNSLAIHLPAQQMLFHPHSYSEIAVRAHSEEYFPVYLWVEVTVLNTPEGLLNAYTRGLEHMGRKELEIYGSPSDVSVVGTTLLQVAHYSIFSDTGLQNGQEFVLPEDTHITVHESASFLIGRSDVYRLQV